MNAIFRAAQAVGGDDRVTAEKLADMVEAETNINEAIDQAKEFVYQIKAYFETQAE